MDSFAELKSVKEVWGDVPRAFKNRGMTQKKLRDRARRLGLCVEYEGTFMFRPGDVDTLLQSFTPEVDAESGLIFSPEYGFDDETQGIVVFISNAADPLSLVYVGWCSSGKYALRNLQTMVGFAPDPVSILAKGPASLGEVKALRRSYTAEGQHYNGKWFWKSDPMINIMESLRKRSSEEEEELELEDDTEENEDE